ncbi:MAG: diaminopimelate epimerase [Arenicellales bacterium]|nr:diaminopimelate epimerase [Arenicellales bacterium]MDP6411500.1 diaminopimelate epimerase [Arenicellales bacterium]
MQSLGNDFVMLDNISTQLPLEPDIIRHLADRHVGIGCDQVIVASPGDDSADFFMRIFNADGTEVGQCGNGARCFARYLIENGWTDKRHLVVQTSSAQLELVLEDGGQVSVNMGTPLFEPAAVPFDSPTCEKDYVLHIGEEQVRIHIASIGNPHAVLSVDDINCAPVKSLGPAIECHPAFPQKANVGFVQVCDRRHLKLRVWERGVGETMACGSGAGAAAAVCRKQGLVDDTVEVELPGGMVEVSWSGRDGLWLRGPATTVYRGEIEFTVT